MTAAVEETGLGQAAGKAATLVRDSVKTVIAASMVAVIKSCVPFTKIRVFVCVTMVLGAPFALLILPHLFEVVAMTGPMWAWFAVAFVVMTAVTAAIIAAQRAWLRSRR